MLVVVPRRLELDLRTRRCPNLSGAHVLALVEAATVVLGEFHASAQVDGSYEHGAERATACLRWDPPTEAVRSSNANATDATEQGAYAVALAVVLQTGFNVVRRAETGTGADWLLARTEEPESFVRLEVSGMARTGDLPARLREKVDQLRSAADDGGVAIVVGFEVARIMRGDA
jgi:hypothetical protein